MSDRRYEVYEVRATSTSYSPFPKRTRLSLIPDDLVEEAARRHMRAQGYSADPNEYEMKWMRAALSVLFPGEEEE